MRGAYVADGTWLAEVRAVASTRARARAAQAAQRARRRRALAPLRHGVRPRVLAQAEPPHEVDGVQEREGEADGAEADPEADEEHRDAQPEAHVEHAPAGETGGEEGDDAGTQWPPPLLVLVLVLLAAGSGSSVCSRWLRGHAGRGALGVVEVVMRVRGRLAVEHGWHQAAAQQHRHRRRHQHEGPQNDELEGRGEARAEHHAAGGLGGLVHLQVGAARRVPPLEVAWEYTVFDLLPAQPAEGLAAVGAFDVVAPPALLHVHLAAGARLADGVQQRAVLPRLAGLGQLVRFARLVRVRPVVVKAVRQLAPLAGHRRGVRRPHLQVLAAAAFPRVGVALHHHEVLVLGEHRRVCG